MEKYVIPLIASALLLTSCASNTVTSNNSGTVSDNVSSADKSENESSVSSDNNSDNKTSNDYINFDYNPKQISALPFTVDFSNDKWIEYFGNKTENKKWALKEVSDADGNKVLALVRAETESPLPPGADYPCLMVGDSSWDNYSVSFDFLSENGGAVIFTCYSDTMNVMNNDSGGSANVWFSIDGNGRVRYLTTDASGDKTLFEIKNMPDTAKWNTVSLKPVDNKLIMSFNGEEVGTLTELSEKSNGGFAISGDIGVAFKNIQITE